MGFAHGWFGMTLECIGSDSQICFEILSDFLEKIAKKKKLGKHGPLRRIVGHPRRGVALHCSVGCLATTRLREAKLALSGTPRRRHYSQRQNFWILFPSTSYSYTDSLRTLINDYWGFK